MYLNVSKDEQRFGVCLGVHVIKDKYRITEIMIFRKEGTKYVLEKQQEVDLENICPEFHFSNENPNELLFFSATDVLKLNYLSEEAVMESVYKFENPLACEPNFGCFSRCQTKLIVTSDDDILYVDLKQPDVSQREIDFDEKEEIGEIKKIFATEERFFVLANKKEHRLGFYLFSIDLADPTGHSEYFIRWTNKLDIGDADMYYMTEKPDREYVVVSYKCIGINTFNVFVFDLKDKLIKYWFEGYQLWESPVKGFLLNTNDFLILSKEGTSLLALGEKESRVVKDKEGQWRMIHALGVCNYLKIEPTNHILFAMQFYEDRQICIQEQYDDNERQTHFDDIFRIKIHEITLRELLLVQSIYACPVQSEIEKLVDAQPDPTIFFKVFLELGIKSMVSYLAFDTKSIRSLLSEKNSKYF